MQFLVVLLRFLLERLITDRRDGLKMAVRADGRIEQLPARWTEWVEQCRQWASVRASRRGSTAGTRWRGDGARGRIRRSD